MKRLVNWKTTHTTRFLLQYLKLRVKSRSLNIILLKCLRIPFSALSFTDVWSFYFRIFPQYASRSHSEIRVGQNCENFRHAALIVRHNRLCWCTTDSKCLCWCLRLPISSPSLKKKIYLFTTKVRMTSYKSELCSHYEESLDCLSESIFCICCQCLLSFSASFGHWNLLHK